MRPKTLIVPTVETAAVIEATLISSARRISGAAAPKMAESKVWKNEMALSRMTGVRP